MMSSSSAFRDRPSEEVSNRKPETAITMDRAAIRRYYVAVSSSNQKLATLMELLTALQHDNSQDKATDSRTSGTAAVVCCCSRDSLDSVMLALLEAPELFTVFVLHSDMSDKERDVQASLLKRAALGRPAEPWNSSRTSAAGLSQAKAAVDENSSIKSRGPDGRSMQPQQRHQQDYQSEGFAQDSTVVLITTDVCLKAIPKDLVPLGVPLLVQFDLARQKETYLKRTSTVFGGGKERRHAAERSIVIDFVAAGEVAAFRASETWFAGTIQEVPVHVSDIFQGTS